MIVAIDGPAGSGKSTIAREIAARDGFAKLDTGAMYRTVALCALRRGVDIADERAVDELARNVEITFGPESHGNVTVSADGVDVSADIRSPEVDRSVSAVASYAGVRTAMLTPQRRFAEGRDVVAEGRDIGTVVFPDVDLRFFLTSAPLGLARRRVLQRHEGEDLAPEAVEREVDQTLADIERRDALDSQREVAPLAAAEDAVEIDSTSFAIGQIVDQIEALIHERR